MSDIIREFFSVSAGTLCFGVLFRVKREHLPLICLGGLLCWGFYLLFSLLISGVFIPTMAASFCIALYAEVLARLLHAPSTPFFAVSMIPLIPGKSLYYTMAAILQQEYSYAGFYATETFAYAFGIAAGMSVVWALCDFSRKIHLLRR